MLFFIAYYGRTQCSHTKQTKHVRICQRTALLDDSRLKFTLAHLKEIFIPVTFKCIGVCPRH